MTIRPTKNSKTRNKFENRTEIWLKHRKVDFEYESERIPYVLEGNYLPDFCIKTKRGKLYIECKGYLRPEDKRKLRAVKRQHPELDIRILFYGEKTKREKEQIKWAMKNNFPYSVETIPREWLR
jgi:predicted nuclease of restriction endonuclease-like RecB superfamily